ncbi:hypothetical protein E8E13_006149 [Curvularia kusanoi]|uniref:Heterokaryon incompatibility domain-containing protein n=1 Tax=Curvularia kusanoi TaxID=90978 RepID=A0A9P4W472_CURKU|nr:hypothetical protein E8E13_006149 [Curvularia kusanoi]
MERYIYRPLPPAKHSIRLIQILPGLPQTDMHCRIIDYTIRDDRVSGLFEALSYVWGKTTDKRKIFVADVASTMIPNTPEGYLEITPNLHEALGELRDPVFSRTLWIDAVCINQDDLDERASQVSFMAGIYSHAIQVVIWLGPGAVNETQELFAAIEDASEIARHPIGDQQPHYSDQSEHEDDKNFLSTALDALLSRNPA